VKTIACSLRTAALLALIATALAAPALAGEDPTLSDIVNILHEKGLIDDAQHEALSAKAAKEQAKHGWTDRINVFGDFRGRFESFNYEDDIYTESAGAHLVDRYRARYRARLGVNAKVVSRASVTLGLNTNGADPRSGNQTLGSGNDFDKDEFRLDLAYATVSPFADGVLPGVDNGYLAFDVGKVKNPFLWKQLPVDNLLIDNDLNPEGGSLRMTGNLGPVALFANGGVYVIQENGGAKDPLLAAGQLGGSIKLANPVSIGARGTFYNFSALNDGFFARGANNTATTGGTGGNIIDGLSRHNDAIQVIETSAFVELRLVDLLPVVFYGTYANNLSARNSVVSNAGREDVAWTVGAFVGDKVRLVRLGAAYYYVEANAFPSMYIDSDVLDGTPNRQGYMASIERQLFEGVDLGLRGFLSDRIRGGTAFANSGPGSDRFRGQADVTFKF